MSKPILLAIHGKILDVSKFVDKHPGEGIRDVYLRDYHRKEATELFDQFHQTDVPMELIIDAKNFPDQSDIKYIAPNFFQKNIPKFYHCLDNNSFDNIDISVIPNKSFFMMPYYPPPDQPKEEKEDQSQKDHKICLFVKDAMGFTNIHPLQIRSQTIKGIPCQYKIERCFLHLYSDVCKDEKTLTTALEAKTIEQFIETYFTKSGYKPVTTLALKN